MQYLTKVIIDGVEVLSNTDGAASPSLASAQLINSACAGAMEIGATASDVLTVTINNPFKASFDGDRVEFYVSPIYDDIETAKGRIAAEVGDDETDEGIDDDETEGIDDDETEGDDMTTAEESATEAYSAELTELQAVFLEGENDGEAEEETDEASDPEWFPLGVYFVNNQNTGDNNVTLTCYDAMALLTDTFVLSGTSSTYSGCWNALATQLESIGIELDPFEFERATDVLAIKENTTLREALGLLCGYVGGYATCDVDGSIGISYYAYTDSVLIDSELLSFVDTSAGDMLIDGVECHDGRGYTLESGGGGQTIAFTNYLVTQDVLDEVIAPTYRGVRFCGASVSAPWEYGLNAGEFVRIMSEDEYRNYLELRNSEDDTVTEQIALGRIILISTQTITFGGNAITAIGSINPTESEKEKIVMSPTIKRIIEAGKTATNYITEDSTGALVIRRDTDNYNVRIDADSLDVRNGDEVLASFGRGVSLGSYGNNIYIDTEPMGGGVTMDIAGYDAIFFGIRGVGNDAGDDVIITGRRGAMLELGVGCSAEQGGAVAMGEDATASKSYSHAHGWGTIADNRAMTAIGKYNTEDSGVAFAIGNGSATKRSDAFSVDWDGNIYAGGHSTPIGDMTPYYKRTSTITINNTWRSVASIKLPPGSWTVYGQVSSNSAISSGNTMSANISETSGYDYAQVTHYTPSDRNNRFQILGFFDVDRETTIHLNAWCSISATLGTNTLLRAMRNV